MYMQLILFPRLDRVRNTSVMSSSLWEYWNSARSVRWSFQWPSTAPVPETDAPLRTRRLDVTVWPGAAGPASGSGRKAYVGSGGKNASLAAMRPGQGGQQNRQHSSLRERPFILHSAGEWQEDHCAIESHINSVLTQLHYKCNVQGIKSKYSNDDDKTYFSVLSDMKEYNLRGWNQWMF